MKRSALPLVGCAGWSIPSATAAAFGAGESALHRYATRFSVVEINSSFYRPHRPETYARWASSVPPSFRFSVKVPRSISHDAGLRATGRLLDEFLDAAGCLGNRLGVLLLQLPPALVYDGRRAAAFFKALRRRTAVDVACEPRHPSWFMCRADALLRRHGIARVAADPPRIPQAAHPGGDTRWSYWRWHGRPRMYYSAYGDPDLAALAASTQEVERPEASWIILDNTAHGFAVPNALRLQTLLKETKHA